MAFYDDFVGTEGQKLHTRTGWTKFGSGWDLFAPEINATNQLRAYSDTSDVALIGQDTGVTDHYVQATVYTGFGWEAPYSGRMLLCVRAVDRSNGFYGVSYNLDEGVWEFMESNSREATYSAPLVGGDVCRIEVEGTAARVYINGVLRMTHTMVYNLSNTRVGVLSRGTPGNDPVLDNYESGPLSAPVDPPTATVTDQSVPDGQDVSIDIITTDATEGEISFVGSGGGENRIIPFSVVNDEASISAEGLDPGHYEVSGDVTGPGGTEAITGLIAFDIVSVSGGGSFH